MRCFFGHISEKTEGSNPSCLKLSKRVATEAFHFLESAVSSGEHGGITIRRLRDSEPLTYTYNLYDEIDIDVIWQLFFKRHEEVFTTADLKRAKKASERGEGDNPERMFYTGTSNRCESFISKLLPSNNNQEEKAALGAIHVALKSRPMKRLRHFQKRKYGTAPTILGQHAVREELDLMSIPQSVSNLTQDPTVEQQEEDNCGILDRQDADEFIFSAGEIVVFRGTDGLKFNLMLVTKNLNRDKTNLRTIVEIS